MGRLRQIMAISIATWQFRSRPHIIQGISDLKPLALWRCAWACAWKSEAVLIVETLPHSQDSNPKPECGVGLGSLSSCILDHGRKLHFFSGQVEQDMCACLFRLNRRSAVCSLHHGELSRYNTLLVSHAELRKARSKGYSALSRF